MMQPLLDTVGSTQTNYPLNNCGEFNAINNALNSGVSVSDLRVYSVDRLSGAYKAPCVNCQNLYGDLVHLLIRREIMSELLESAGYTKERTIDVTSIVKMYAENGYHYNDKQIDFIRSFGNLEIHYNHPVWNEDMVIKIDPIEAQKTITMDIVEDWSVKSFITLRNL